MRILIAETDGYYIAAMSEALEQAGYQVTVTNDGIIAWDLLAAVDPPDLLVTRVTLGGLGKPHGPALGSLAYSRAIPVIYIPADDDRANHADEQHGAVLVKPFRADDLVRAAQALLARFASARVGTALDGARAGR